MNSQQNLEQRLELAVEEARNGSSSAAMVELEELVRLTNHPSALAWLGYCLAVQQQDYSRALVLCTSAVHTTPDDADLYLALGRVYRLAGRRYQALSTLRRGLKLGRHELIMKELTLMGTRKEPVFSVLDRANRLNVVAGRVMTKFKFR
ncbi:tetratricopeptide repeat protein [Geopsychrobacter electrodiphilus]|uniref:tetratricopeptide repeat protein n=1 Tax=Geopsychrobacter electrodiphilus TaxID=225196 RepID=UPI00036DBCAE|nr:tetratricopeptide repeat protein [Geopsychrobacter electrodiphilus]